jgi:hypothetical protein
MDQLQNGHFLLVIKTPKPHESIISHGKLILVEKIFQDINKYMLEVSYTLNLG